MSAVVDRMGPAVEVAGLTKAYGDRTVVRDLSFRIAAGEVFALLGPNGAGKTTTVEIVEGYRRPDRGSINVLGVDPAHAGRDHRARVGLMLQGGGGIEPRMTAREVVGLHARFHAAPRDPDELLRVVGLSGAAATTRFRRLSGGERQRLSLALALVGRPAVAILDEPTAGMDVEARAATRELLRDLRDDGTAILLTSHDLADVERVADRIAIIDRGRLVAIGPPDDLAGGSPVLRFQLAAPLSEADRSDLVARLAETSGQTGAGATIEKDGGPGRYRLAGLAPSPATVAVLAAWCEARGALISELRTGGGTLEERYLDLIAATPDEPDADVLP
jgi:ABC-2 type transport system ATP-binding protein